MKKIYMGFSVDMDRAYSDYNSHGQIISKKNIDYEKYMKYKHDFIDLTNKLINYFNKNNYDKSVTWFINEADYHITLYFPDILKKCKETGEIGLHTHLNSRSFNSDFYTMSRDRKDWEERGIIEANKSINKLIDYNNYIYKAGNHIRCDELFDCLSDNNFSIDTTMDINNKNFEKNHLFYDDTNIPLGYEPFFLNCNNNNVILEIPEIRIDKVIDHIDKCKENNNLCFIKLQIHHWQYDELIPEFDNLIKKIKNLGYNIDFVNLKTMQKIFFKKIHNNLDKYLLKNIHNLIPKDTYYCSLNKIISNDFFDLSIWLFNNIDKRKKILELFSGIGQCSLLLHKLKFKNLTICDFDENRCNFYKLLDNNYNNINVLVSNFYDVNLNNYDVIFFGNSINSSLCDKIDIQIKKYQDFIDENKILIIHEKYGSGMKEFNNLLDKLKNYKIIKSFNKYHIIKKFKISKNIIPFSNKIKTYNKIGFDNISDDIIIENNYQLIRLKIGKNIKSSAGIYFSLNYVFPNLEEKIHKCKITFDVKIENPDLNNKIKIYTGIKWVIIEKDLTNTFQTIEFINDFNFFRPSTYRIGFVNIESNILYLKNIDINYKYINEL